MVRIPFRPPPGIGFDIGRDILKDLPEWTRWMFMPVLRRYYQVKQRFHPTRYDYSKTTIDEYARKARARETAYYGVTDTWLFQALDDFPIRGLHGLIVGSAQPWYEAIAITFGCANVTVVEYRDQPCDYPNIKFVRVENLDDLGQEFDFAVSISSIEHDGLGRYGDPVCKDADLKAMASHKRLLRPEGLLYLAVPVGLDQVVGNMHRIYGRKRLPRLLWGFNVVGSYGFADKNLDLNNEHCLRQPVFVLRPWDRSDSNRDIELV